MKVYNKLSEETEREKFIDLLKYKKNSDDLIKKLTLKPKEFFEKWVEPKSSPTPKTAKKIKFPSEQDQ